MKICMVSTDFLPNIGGIAQHIFEISKALQKQGNQVQVLTIDKGSQWSGLSRKPFEERMGELQIWRIPYVLNTFIPFISGQVSSRWSSRRFAQSLIEKLEVEKPDVVHWHALETTVNPFLSWRNAPLVWTNHTSMFLDQFETSPHRPRLVKEAQIAQQIIAPSNELAEKTIQLGVPADQVHFISNGVDANRFSSSVPIDSWKQKLKLRENEKVILCPRRLERKNGVRYFVKAAITLLKDGIKNVRFVIAGDFVGNQADSETDEVSSLVRESFPDRINLLGRVENADMPSLYALASMVVIPSLQEATSLSALEAMASSKPVVATNVGGLPYLVENEKTGLLVSPENSEKLAEAMKSLLHNPRISEEYGTMGRRRVEVEFDWSQIAKRTLEVYQRAINFGIVSLALPTRS
jgi:glycosyltransferase involved in cell wall biosynthesis